MTQSRRGALLVAGILLLLGPRAWAAAPPPEDPLPPGAVARLGTVRLRHLRPVESVVFARDGTTVITAAASIGGGGPEDEIRFYDIATGRLVRRLRGQPFGPDHLALSPDGNTLASVSGGRDSIRLWDLTTGKPLHDLEPKEGTTLLDAVYSPDGKSLVACGAGGLQVWDVRTGKHVRAYASEDGGWNLALAPGGIRAATVESQAVRLWDLSTGKEVWRFALENVVPHPAPFSPDGKVLASGGFDETVRVWDLTSGKERWCGAGEGHPVTSVAFSPEGQTGRG